MEHFFFTESGFFRIFAVLKPSDFYDEKARKYWKVQTGRLKKEGNETVTNCHQLIEKR